MHACHRPRSQFPYSLEVALRPNYFVIGHHLSERGMVQLKSQQQQEAEAISYEQEPNAPPVRTPEPEIVVQQPSMDQPSGWSLPPLYSILGPNDGPPSMRTRSTTSIKGLHSGSWLVPLQAGMMSADYHWTTLNLSDIFVSIQRLSPAQRHPRTTSVYKEMMHKSGVRHTHGWEDGQ